MWLIFILVMNYDILGENYTDFFIQAKMKGINGTEILLASKLADYPSNYTVCCPCSRNESLLILPGVLDPDLQFLIGLFLALCSSLFIGSSFIMKKKSLISLDKKGKTRASAGGLGYFKVCLWWAGFLSMATGKLKNAYLQYF